MHETVQTVMKCLPGLYGIALLLATLIAAQRDRRQYGKVFLGSEGPVEGRRRRMWVAAAIPFCAANFRLDTAAANSSLADLNY